MIKIDSAESSSVSSTERAYGIWFIYRYFEYFNFSSWIDFSLMSSKSWGVVIPAELERISAIKGLLGADAAAALA